MGYWRPTFVNQRNGSRIGWLIPLYSREERFHYYVECEFCNSSNLVRYGVSSGGGQRYLCKTCSRTFVDNDAPPGMRFPAAVIASALNLFYEGASLESIRRHIKLAHHDYPGHATVYDWIVKYTKKAVKDIGDVQVQTGDIWAADETVLKVAGSRTKEGADNTIWFWDVIDEDTRFLLASHMSQTRTVRDAETLFNQATRASVKPPKFIITDKLAAYQEGIERVFGSDTTHVQSKGMRSSTHNNISERSHGTIKQRTKVMRGLHSKESARLVMDGWLVHYNFFRPHESLKGKTPGEAAGAEIPFTSWQDVVSDRKVERNPKRVRKTKVTLLPGRRKK